MWYNHVKLIKVKSRIAYFIIETKYTSASYSQYRRLGDHDRTEKHKDFTQMTEQGFIRCKKHGVDEILKIMFKLDYKD